MTLNDMLETCDTYTSRGLEERTDVRYFKDSSYRPKIHRSSGGWGIKPPKTGGFNEPFKPYPSVPKWRGERPYQGYNKPYTGFKPAKDFGIGGGGIANKVYGTPFIDRYRPDNHKPFGPHINMETMLPFGKKKRPILGNIHFKYKKY